MSDQSQTDDQNEQEDGQTEEAPQTEQPAESPNEGTGNVEVNVDNGEA